MALVAALTTRDELNFLRGYYYDALLETRKKDKNCKRLPDSIIEFSNGLFIENVAPRLEKSLR